jgi:hypothetical protein
VWGGEEGATCLNAGNSRVGFAIRVEVSADLVLPRQIRQSGPVSPV